MDPLLFLTGNSHKFEEISAFLTANTDYQVIQKNLPLQELQAETLEEIAQFKLQSAQLPSTDKFFIEDAGFFVDDVCSGFPGPYSSYVMKTIGYDGILKIMANKEERKAHFEACIGYSDEKGQLHFFHGVVRGRVALTARGTSGFGFDPIFIPDEFPEKTFAELTMAEKNQISHRSRALAKFLKFLIQKS